MYFKHKNIYFTVILIIFFAILIFINTAQANNLIFTEIMYNPEGSDQDNEWVEVFNLSTSTISIESDWRFNDGSNHLLNLYQGNNQIATSSFFIITADAITFLNNYADFAITIFESSMSLNNTQDTIQLLKDNGNELITEVSYNSSLGGNGNGMTIEKIDVYTEQGEWQESYIIGGTPGDFPSTPLPNQAPIAMAGDDITAIVNQEITFDGSNSYDPDGDEINFLWDFAGFSSSTSAIATYQFESTGIFEVILTVSDGQTSSTDLLIVTVEENQTNEPPIIIVNEIPETVEIGELIDLNACNSYDPEGFLLNFLWDFGDEGQSTGCQSSYRYYQSNIYEVELIVNDGENNAYWQQDIIVNSNNAQIVINELLPNPEGSDDAEWIELKNIGDNTVNLENWYLKDESGKKYTLSLDDFNNLNINTNDYLLIERSTSGIALNNSSETVYLFNNLENKAHEISYQNVKENESWAMFDNGWEWTEVLTPGAQNQKNTSSKPNAVIDLLSEELIVGKEIILTAENSSDENGQGLEYKWYVDGSLKDESEEFKIVFDEDGLKEIKLIVINDSGLEGDTTIYLNIINNGSAIEDDENFICSTSSYEIIISEVLPNPIGSDENEFIELFNPNGQDIDLTNWKLNDASSYFYNLTETIKAKDYLVIQRNDSKISLNNSNEELKLFDCNDNLIWQLSYEKSFEAQSYSYDPINEVYFWTDEQTHGKENSFIFNEDNINNTNIDDYGIYDISEIKELENSQNVIVNGVITVLPNQLYSNTAYICYYSLINQITNFDECIAIYLKDNWTDLDYGYIVEIQGTVSHLKRGCRIKIKNPEDIIILDSINLPNFETYDIEEIDEELINSMIAVEGTIKEINKKSFYILDDEEELKIKINNDEIDLSDFSKDDLITIQGLLINYQDKLTLLPRNQDDLTKQEILGVSEQKETASSTEIINLNDEKNKKSNTVVWVLGLGLVMVSGILIKKNWRLIKDKVTSKK